MAPRTRLNLSLAAVVAGLALLAWLAGPTTTVGVADIDPAAIDRIEIQQGDGTRLAFARTATGWFTDDGTPLAVNPERLRPLLNLPATPVEDRLPAASVDRDGLGLAPPTLSLRLDQHVFDFGDTDPIADRRYVHYRDTIYLLEDRLYPLLRQGRHFFVDPRLLPPGFDLQRLRLPGRELGAGDPAAAVLFERWQQAQASRVLPGEDGTEGEVILAQGRERSIRFRLLETETGPVLARPDAGLRYQLDSVTAAGLGLDGTRDE